MMKYEKMTEMATYRRMKWREKDEERIETWKLGEELTLEGSTSCFLTGSNLVLPTQTKSGMIENKVFEMKKKKFFEEWKEGHEDQN